MPETTTTAVIAHISLSTTANGDLMQMVERVEVERPSLNMYAKSNIPDA